MTDAPRLSIEPPEHPLDLPLFASRRPASDHSAALAAGRSVGRVRSDFSITRTPEPRNGIHLVHPEPAVTEPAVPGLGLARRPVRHDAEQIDWALVAAFRQQASKRLMEALGGSGVRYVPEEEKREVGRAIIVEMVQAHAADVVSRGERGWSASMVEAMAKAVFDSQFRMGRLQPLLEQDDVENIMITGFDRVVLEDADGAMRQGPPVADSDQELIDFLVFLASRSQVNPRPFSEAIPALHMRLDGGERWRPRRG